jgi:zinc transporter ZupT
LSSAVITTGIGPPLLAALIGVAGVFLGLWLTTAGRRTRLVVPFSAGVLLGVVLFGLLPELVEEIGWQVTGIFFAGGYGLLYWIGRHVAPVCPSCAHDHDHQSCGNVLHGFAAPMIGASMLHSFFDGWSVAAAQMAAHHGVRLAVALAVALHKIPEGIALGAIVRASVASRSSALFWSVSVEATTLVGGILGLAIAPHLSTAWIAYPLALAAGWLFYLGAHALQAWFR